MSDYDFLLNPQGLQIQQQFDPMAVAARRLTLGQLANTVESGGLDLQQRRQAIALMQDPRFADAYSQLISSGGGGPAATYAGLMKDYPAAAGPALGGVLGQAKEIVGINKTKAETDKAQTESARDALMSMTNIADGLSRQKGDVTVAQILQFAQVASGFPTGGRITSQMLAAFQSGQNPKEWFANFSQAGANMAQRATAGKETAETAVVGPRYDLDRQKVLLDWAQKTYGGEIQKDVNGNFVIMRPNSGVPPLELPPAAAKLLSENGISVAAQPTQAPTAAPAVTPAAPAVGAPAPSQPTSVKAALSPAEQTLSMAREQKVKEAMEGAQIGQQTLQIVPALRDELRRGQNLNGPIFGSESGKAFLNLAASLGIIKGDTLEKYASIRGSDPLAAELIGNFERKISQRGSNMALQFSQRVKPGSQNALDVSMRMLDVLEASAKTAIDYNRSLASYVQSNPNDYSVSGFKAPQPQIAGTKMDTMPPASVKTIGRFHDDNGDVWVNKYGRSWVNEKTGEERK